jgi:LCP family protein required for cell wall assembly
MTTTIRQDPGTRSGRRKALRRRRFVQRGLIGLLVAALIAGASMLIARTASHHGGKASGPAVERQHTVLLAMTLHDDPSNQASALTLFGIDPDGTNPVALFIPVGTLGPIPGLQDFDMVGQALSVGQPVLQQVTIENLLGINIDRTVSMDDVTLGTIIDAVGGITVDVEERLYDTQPNGTKTLLFPMGSHHMNGAAAVTYLTYQSDDTTELDSFVRAQKIWEGLFTATRKDPTKLATVLAHLDPTDVPAADATWLSSEWRAFAARSADDRTYEVLPGQQIGAGGPTVSYQIDQQKLDDMIARDFSGSVPQGTTPGTRPRVELRNGNGSPGIGERAAGLLVPAGLRIEVTGNAKNFGYRTTLIIVYGDDAASLALARKIRGLLGVGAIQVGTRAETVVDVTVVLGKDFVERPSRS